MWLKANLTGHQRAWAMGPRHSVPHCVGITVRRILDEFNISTHTLNKAHYPQPHVAGPHLISFIKQI